MILMVGCGVSSDESEVSAEVKACRARAAETCDSIGFGNNERCILVFAKLCSADDEEAAREMCVAESGLADDAPCCLKWR